MMTNEKQINHNAKNFGIAYQFLYTIVTELFSFSWNVSVMRTEIDGDGY